MRPLAPLLLCTILGISTALAHPGRVELTVSDGEICVLTWPDSDHDMSALPGFASGAFGGDTSAAFPGRVPGGSSASGPGSLGTRTCVPKAPTKNAVPKPHRGAIGVGLNGDLIRPRSAASQAIRLGGRPGDGTGGMGAASLLGARDSVIGSDERGLYQVQGLPLSVLAVLVDGQIGWAADGFPLVLGTAEQRSSWQLKPADPDGIEPEDWEYVPGSGSLDECNGGTRDGQFAYFVTATFPFYPRCLWGDASVDFAGTGANTGQWGGGAFD